MKVKLPFRRQYFRMAKRAFDEGKLGWLARSGAQAFAVPVADWLDRPLGGPVMVNLVPTYRCNNACVMCDLPKPSLYGARGGEELGTARLKAVIDEVAGLGTVGLSFAGGEPTVRPDCFELLAHASEAGLFAHLNSNGYNLHRPERIDALLATGLESINLSLDGATARTHDAIRRVSFGFDRIARATELILERRDRGRPQLVYTFVLGPNNHHEVPAFVELAARRGVDAVSFNPLTPCYEGATPPSEDELEGIDRAVEWLRAEKARRGDDFIDNSDAFLGLFGRALRAEPSPLKCYVGYHNLVIDAYGHLYSCTLMYQNGESSGNLAEGSLHDFWYGRRYQARRRELTRCHDCYWNCHTELNLLLQRA